MHLKMMNDSSKRHSQFLSLNFYSQLIIIIIIIIIINRTIQHEWCQNPDCF